MIIIIRDQRARYHDIRSKAEVDSSIMSIIIDGMDQSATNLPHLKKISKSTVNLWHLRTHLTGTCTMHIINRVELFMCMFYEQTNSQL